MSLIRDDGSFDLTWAQSLFARVIKRGKIPRHVAFIMDGNRRYASKTRVQKIEGHSKGFDKLAESLKWCQDLGVEEVTVYVFSAENFKRTKEEVDGLMELARQKFAIIMNEKEKLEAHGVRVCVVGELSLLAPDIRQMAENIQDITKSNNKCRLNICLAYTSRLEMTAAIRELAWGVQSGLLLPDDITDELFTDTLEIPSVDLVIRTSGEVRLSDFLLWQSSFSYLSFLKALWPEFSIWDFYGAILQYQRAHPSIEQAKHSKIASHDILYPGSQDLCSQTEKQLRVKAFMEHLKVKRGIICNNE